MLDITPANIAKNPQFETMVEGAKAQRMMAGVVERRDCEGIEDRQASI